MTLDEAIEHANQVADSYKDTAPACKCAREHRQLAEWLRELRQLRIENAKLRKLARLLLYGATHDAEPAEGLVWSQKVNVLVRELVIEVDDG